METIVERIVIMPATVGRWRKNLQPFSALRSFDQAQGVDDLVEERLLDCDQQMIGQHAQEGMSPPLR